MGHDGKCRGAVQEWCLWKAGERESVAVQLCAEHSKPLAAVYRLGIRRPLPTKPRMSLHATKLKTVRETRHLKRPQK
jgi:hypothetical protein